MAKNSRLSKIAEEKNELEMTPMIDVTFLLLIFFMCTLKFKILEGKLGAYLPKDVGAQATPQEEIEKFKIQLRVKNEGRKLVYENGSKSWIPYDPEVHQGRRFQYDESREIEYTMNTYATTDLGEVDRRLKTVQEAAERMGEKSARVELDPRERTTQLDVVTLLDVVLNNDITEVNFTGSFEK